jgi:hypothetical protein
MIIQIYHSSFARYALMREKARKGETCAECGQKAKYRYRYENDDSARNAFWQKESFCSVSCMRQYHSIEETP